MPLNHRPVVRVIPVQPALRIRLLAHLPLEVAFTGITYYLAVARAPVSGLWQLEARYAGGCWLCEYRSSEDKLRKAIYEEGLKFAGASVPRVIFERLVKEGRAETVGAGASVP